MKPATATLACFGTADRHRDSHTRNERDSGRYIGNPHAHRHTLRQEEGDGRFCRSRLAIWARLVRNGRHGTLHHRHGGNDDYSLNVELGFTS